VQSDNLVDNTRRAQKIMQKSVMLIQKFEDIINRTTEEEKELRRGAGNDEEASEVYM
jgi:hypothetical protein